MHTLIVSPTWMEELCLQQVFTLYTVVRNRVTSRCLLLLVLGRQRLGLAGNTALLCLAKRSLLTRVEEVSIFLRHLARCCLHLLAHLGSDLLEVLLAINRGLGGRIGAASGCGRGLRRALVFGRQPLSLSTDAASRRLCLSSCTSFTRLQECGVLEYS